MRIVVQPLDELGVAGDAQLLALGKPELLVDERAQQVPVALGDLLHGGAVLARFIIHLLQGAVIVRARDDLIVHAGHDLLHRGAAKGALRRDGMRLRESVSCEQQRAKHERRGSAKKSLSHSKNTAGCEHRRLFHRRHCKRLESGKAILSPFPAKSG